MTKLKASLCIILAMVINLAMSAPSQAQINFGIKTEEIVDLEKRVNRCANEQNISACFNALSRAHIIQISYANAEYDADRIMRNATMLLPLYMLAELYDRKDQKDLSCGYARSGERQLHKLLETIDMLMAKDPTAFKNVDKTKQDLQDVQARFDKALARCD